MSKVFLDKRLLAAAQLVRPGSCAADIGCDHGKLSAYLVQTGICSRVIAADVRSGPLSAAKRLVEECGLSASIDCRLGDGLDPVKPGEATEIVIAGMGGETIAGILDRAPWVKDAALGFILVPASAHSFLRRWLCQNGFALVKEEAVCEAGHWYVVMRAEYTGHCFEPDAAFCVGGLQLGRHTPQAGGYLAVMANRLKKELCGKQKAGRYQDLRWLRSLVQQLEQEVALCQKQTKF